MLSLPVDWDYTLKGLFSINKESIDAIRIVVWELEKPGTLSADKGGMNKARWRVHYFI
ncbi:hypothetical protein BN3662_00606 [Clostridiales bacterium CHKCI006]|nr:hypothetical protein BN3662_00606 [Clostridiales bacterium CHKCI006]